MPDQVRHDKRTLDSQVKKGPTFFHETAVFEAEVPPPHLKVLCQEPRPQRIGGFLSAQGLACSNWAASRKRPASSPKRLANCTPMGTSFSFQNSGTDIAGWPVIFCVRVNATKDSAVRIHLVGSSGVDSKAPSFVGGILIVGERSMS